MHRRGTQIGALHTLTRRCQTYRLCSWAASFATPKDGDSAHGGHAPPHEAQWQSQPQQPSRLPCSAIHAMWGLIAVINDKVAFGDAIGTAIETAKRAQRKRRRCMRKKVNASNTP